MNIEITSELLLKISERATQYAITRFGKEPDFIQMDSNGGVIAVFVNYCGGDRDDVLEYISAENLTEDLDAVAKERKEKEEAERKRQEELSKQREARRVEQKEANEKAEYLRLKKKFGE